MQDVALKKKKNKKKEEEEEEKEENKEEEEEKKKKKKKKKKKEEEEERRRRRYVCSRRYSHNMMSGMLLELVGLFGAVCRFRCELHSRGKHRYSNSVNKERFRN